VALGSTQDRIFEAKLALFRRSELAELRDFARCERLDPEQLARLQRERAAALVRFALEHSEFYRERYAAAGVRARDLEDPQAFPSLPLVTRADVREHRERIRTHEATPSNVQHAVTGGTTGEPLRVMRDRRANHRVLGWRLARWWGVGPGANKALIWRDADPSRRHTWKHDLLWWPTRTVQMDANAIDARSIARFLDGWERIRPALFSGYAGAVVELAQQLARAGRKLRPPRAISTTSSPITPGQKQFVSEVFGAPVYDTYQCVEAPMLAGECAHSDGLHVFADARWLEILREDGSPTAPGEEGDVVITDFRNRVFPLIRYRLGDKARWRSGACPCGVTFPLLEPVTGRITDVFRFPSGLTIAGVGMCAIFHPWPEAVRQFQVRQEADYSLTLQCVRGSDPNADEIMRRVRDRLAEKVRGEVPVRLEVVDEIRHDRGKQRFIVSLAPPAAR
jgi:phenylacetate-CoA ligase